MADIKLGRKPRLYGPTLKWETLRNLARVTPPTPLPVMPPAWNWLLHCAPDFTMMGNDVLGDCVCAACLHAVQVWSSVSNPPEDTEPTQTAVRLYEQDCGYIPGQPKTDQGCWLQAVLADWHGKGITMADGSVDRLYLPPIEITPSDFYSLREATYQCGAVAIGFNVPQYIYQAPPPVWRYDPTGDQTIVGGHAVVVGGYHKKTKGSSHYFDFVSWGRQYKMDGGFWTKFVDEAYALVSMRWIEATGRTPAGLTMDQVVALAKVL
jgi:hypothetical protein